jgi:g-D-glutamyl-meso-diaminopimelate peptidase
MEKREKYITKENEGLCERDFFESPLDYDRLCGLCLRLCEQYPSISLSYVGNSLLSRRIPLLCFGEGEKSVFYIAGHHASEWLCGNILLRFLWELGGRHKRGESLFSRDLEYLRRSRRIFVCPCLNVDGAEIQINGKESAGPLEERLLRANGSEDFTHWQANARGVDLNHNYDSDFYRYRKIAEESGIVCECPSRYAGEYPESEPEVSAVCNFLRYYTPSLVLSFHSQGEVIYSPNAKLVKNGEFFASRISSLCSYSLADPEGLSSYSGLSDWYTYCHRRPSFTVECGKGKNPLPLSDGERIYARLRRLLFSAPGII